MLFKVIGIQNVDFTNNHGEKIVGKNLFCAYEDVNTEGFKCEKIFAKPELLPKDLKANDTVEASFTMNGKLDSIKLIK